MARSVSNPPSYSASYTRPRSPFSWVMFVNYVNTNHAAIHNGAPGYLGSVPITDATVYWDFIHGPSIGGGANRMRLNVWSTSLNNQVVQLEPYGGNPFLDDTWYVLGCVQAAANDWRAYVAALGASSVTSQSTGSNFDNAPGGSTVTHNLIQTRIGPETIWNEALTADELLSIVKGYSARLIRPHAIQRHWEFIGNDSPEPELKAGNGMVITGTGAKFDHPRIIMPCGVQQ